MFKKEGDDIPGEVPVLREIELLVHPFYGHDLDGDPSRKSNLLKLSAPYYENMPKYSWRGLDSDTYGSALLFLWLDRLENIPQDQVVVMFPYNKHPSVGPSAVDVSERSPLEGILVGRLRKRFGKNLIVEDTTTPAVQELWRRYADKEFDFSPVTEIRAYGEMSHVCVPNYLKIFSESFLDKMDQDSRLDEVHLRPDLLLDLCADTAPQEKLDRFISQSLPARRYGLQLGTGQGSGLYQVRKGQKGLHPTT